MRRTAIPAFPQFRRRRAESKRGYCGRTAPCCHRDILRTRRSRASKTLPILGTLLRASNVPLPAECGLEPRRENRPAEMVAGAGVAQISGAVAGRNIQGPAERDRQRCIVAANPATFLVGFRRRPCYPGVLIAKIDPLIYKIADCLDARPAGGRILNRKSRPDPTTGRCRRNEKREGRRWPLREASPPRSGRRAAPPDRADRNRSRQRRSTGAHACAHPAAPIAKTIAVAGDRNRGLMTM